MPTKLSENTELRLSVEVLLQIKNEVLIQKRPTDANHFPDFIVFPGGHIDSNETPIGAAKRELFEETGVDVEIGDLKLRAQAINHHSDKLQTWVVFVFSTELIRILS